MKKIILWLSVLLCTLVLAVGVSAEDSLFVLDWADLLTAEEETALNAYLAEISAENSANIIVAAVESTEGDSAQSFADNLYDAGLPYFGLPDGTEDGALFLVAMNEREWAISTSGYGITAVTEQVLDHMEREIVPCLSEGNYYEAFFVFGELCNDCWNPDPALKDGYYDVYPGDICYDSAGETVHHGSSFGPQWIAISLIVGFLIALIPMGMLKSQLNTVHMQTGALSYQKQDSVRITRSEDLFLYRNVTKKPIPRDDPPRSGGHGGPRPGGSIHMGSSGRSHGGRSGRF